MFNDLNLHWHALYFQEKGSTGLNHTASQFTVYGPCQVSWDGKIIFQMDIC